jgi:uncharacterized protein YycO
MKARATPDGAGRGDQRPTGGTHVCSEKTHSEVSHSILYADHGSVVEAIGEGVVSRSLADSIVESDLAVVYRYPGLSSKQVKEIVAFARSKVGEGYNYVGAVKMGYTQGVKHTCARFPRYPGVPAMSLYAAVHCLDGIGQSGDVFFCSQLIVAAYQKAGINLGVLSAETTSPGDLSKLSSVNYVGHLKA